MGLAKRFFAYPSDYNEAYACNGVELNSQPGDSTGGSHPPYCFLLTVSVYSSCRARSEIVVCTVKIQQEFPTSTLKNN